MIFKFVDSSLEVRRSRIALSGSKMLIQWESDRSQWGLKRSFGWAIKTIQIV
jgi:hypothetical protein